MKERVPTIVCDYYYGHSYFFVNMVLFSFFHVFNEIFSLGKQTEINPQPLMDMVYIFICFVKPMWQTCYNESCHCVSKHL
jgi:hypothetical protein